MCFLFSTLTWPLIPSLIFMSLGIFVLWQSTIWDDFVGAEKDVGQAINLNPYYNEMYDLRAICRIRQSKFKEAISDYDQAILIDPRNQNYWFNRALCHFQEKDYPGAQQELDTIITKWNHFANAYSLKAEVSLIQKDTTTAARMLDKSLAYDPYNVGAWRTRGADQPEPASVERCRQVS
jgi:tetratricopeptide (TPR) repeat protein